MANTDTVELWSHIYFTEDAIDTATCTLEKSAWTRLMNHRDHEGSTRLFGKIEVQDKTLYIAVGSYIEAVAQEPSPHIRVILPLWALDVLSALGTGDIAVVTWLTEDAFPPATRMVLRPHDSAFYHSDAKEELEIALTRIGVLQQGQTIMVTLQALGDYPISFDVVELEPANVVLADGEEVAIEFEAALDVPPEMEPRPDTPIPECDFTSMISEPTTLISEPQGRTLGGTNRYTADGKPWNPHRGT